MHDGRNDNGLRRLSAPPLSSDARFMRSLSFSSFDICSPAPPLPTIATSQFRAGLQRVYFLGHLDGRIDPAAVSRMKVAAIIKLRGGDARRKNFAKVIPLSATEGEASEAG